MRYSVASDFRPGTLAVVTGTRRYFEGEIALVIETGVSGSIDVDLRDRVRIMIANAKLKTILPKNLCKITPSPVHLAHDERTIGSHH